MLVELRYNTMVTLVLSADPASHPDDYVIMTIYGGCRQLAFLRAGDNAWTILDPNFEAGCVWDIVCYKDQFCLSTTMDKLTFVISTILDPVYLCFILWNVRETCCKLQETQTQTRRLIIATGDSRFSSWIWFTVNG